MRREEMRRKGKEEETERGQQEIDMKSCLQLTSPQA